MILPQFTCRGLWASLGEKAQTPWRGNLGIAARGRCPRPPSPAPRRPRALPMNYLRGAVSAISAPYQYYKDINPATLTGAIDVIVISRPRTDDADHPSDGPPPSADDDGRELACSPFHVRFGKWQVLRPADKKVSSTPPLTACTSAPLTMHTAHRSTCSSTATSYRSR